MSLISRVHNWSITAKSLIAPAVTSVVLCATLGQFALSRQQITSAEDQRHQATEISFAVGAAMQDFTHATGALFRAIAWASMGVDNKLITATRTIAADDVIRAMADVKKLDLGGLPLVPRWRRISAASWTATRTARLTRWTRCNSTRQSPPS